MSYTSHTMLLCFTLPFYMFDANYGNGGWTGRHCFRVSLDSTGFDALCFGVVRWMELKNISVPQLQLVRLPSPEIFCTICTPFVEVASEPDDSDNDWGLEDLEMHGKWMCYHWRLADKRGRWVVKPVASAEEVY